MKIVIEHCDICKDIQNDPTNKNWHWTQSFGHNCSLDLKSVAQVQTKIEWECLCPSCAREIMDTVTKVVQARFKELKP